MLQPRVFAKHVTKEKIILLIISIECQQPRMNENFVHTFNQGDSPTTLSEIPKHNVDAIILVVTLTL